MTLCSLKGTTVSRASLCNVSELERLGIGKDRKTELRIIKANKIIPKCIAVVRAEGSYEVPSACPVCGAATEVRISPGERREDAALHRSRTVLPST